MPGRYLKRFQHMLYMWSLRLISGTAWFPIHCGKWLPSTKLKPEVKVYYMHTCARTLIHKHIQSFALMDCRCSLVVEYFLCMYKLPPPPKKNTRKYNFRSQIVKSGFDTFHFPDENCWQNWEEVMLLRHSIKDLLSSQIIKVDSQAKKLLCSDLHN